MRSWGTLLPVSSSATDPSGLRPAHDRRRYLRTVSFRRVITTSERTREDADIAESNTNIHNTKL